MRMLDASSIIHAWDEYPASKFLKLWEWLKKLIEKGDLTICSVAFEEVVANSPECAEWLDAAEIQKFPVTNAILIEANRIKQILGIVGDKFHTDGVGENDLIIIATAKHHQATLMSDEAIQTSLPANKSRYKIPAACALGTVSVDCVKFSRFFKASNETF